MKQLTVRIKGVLQSWGDYGGPTNFQPTNYKPTVSGIHGLLEAGMGIKRVELERKARVENGVKVFVKEPETFPEIYTDFQVVLPKGTSIGKYLGKKKRPEDMTMLPAAGGGFSTTGATKVIQKQYIVDQAFDIVLEGEDSLMEEVKYGLLHPYYQLTLGKANCTASMVRIIDEQDF